MMTAPRRASAPPVPDVRGLRIPERTLELLRDLIESRLGIFYDDGRFEILRDRIAPLAIDRGFDSLLDYYYLLKYDAAAALEWPRVMDALSVQETYFWREADHFTALARLIVPRLIERGKRNIRISSIPCASGEEPLSIAMALTEAGLFDQANIEIHAADASEAALAKAGGRRYSGRSFRQLSEAMQDKYFIRDSGKEEWSVRPELFSRITSWSRVNIVNVAEMSALASADVVFCRNLFIYFTPACVREVATNLARFMPSPGYLCVGAAESLLKAGAGFDLQELGGAYVYVKQ
ncbi:MAG TPA: CheR family methyltransferase [Vicinamibacterales bacterium]|nr:CheR family methyltransferase [Vicinamibacterales bacterium]